MNITHYFLEMSFCTQTKNQLQKEAREYLDSISGKLIQAQDLVELKRTINNQIAALNEKHNRCKALIISFDKSHTGNLFLNGIPPVTFYLKKSELSHITQFIR